MNQKGFEDFIDVAIQGMVGLMLLSLLIGIFWPIVTNFVLLTVNIPNYTMYSPIVLAIPAIIVILFVVALIRRFSRPPQQPGYGY